MKKSIERFGLDLIWDNVIARRVPKTPWYHGDGATLIMLLSVQVLTGLVLTLSYSNSTHSSFSSLQHITNFQTMGWFIRGLHYWSSGLMIVMLLFHVFRLIMVGGYKAPREGTWITGVILFFLVWIMAYSGYTLRWNEQAIYAVKVLLNILYRIPLIGDSLVFFVQGGESIGPLTLSRLFALHVIFVPILLIGVVSFHMYLVILHGVTSWAEREAEVETAKEQKEVYDKAAESKVEGEDFFPVTMASSGFMAFVVFLIVLTLTLIWGAPELGEEANLVNDAFPAEEWWFAWYSSIIALLPPWAVTSFVIGFPIILFFLMVLLPFLDRNANRGISARPGWVALVAIFTICLIGLTAYRMRSPWTAWPITSLPKITKTRILTEDQKKGFHLFNKYGCTTCHGVAGEGRTFAVDITKINWLLSKNEIQNFILNPPSEIAMPAYKGRMSDEELRYIVEFVHVFQIQPGAN
jgi:ubiquinol-cytochrome c reductase cytochrome b subunit